MTFRHLVLSIVTALTIELSATNGAAYIVGYDGTTDQSPYVLNVVPSPATSAGTLRTSGQYDTITVNSQNTLAGLVQGGYAVAFDLVANTSAYAQNTDCSGPVASAVTADDRFGIIVNQRSDNLSVLDASNPLSGFSTKNLSGVVTSPTGIAINPNHNFIYISAAKAIATLSLPNFSFGVPVKLEDSPNDIAITSDGKSIFTACDSGYVYYLDSSSGTPNTLTPLKLTSAGNLKGIAISKDNQRAFVVDYDNNQLFVVRTASFIQIGSPISLPVTHPTKIVIRPDGLRAYVIAESKQVVEINIDPDLLTPVVGSPIPLPFTPKDIVMAPAQAPVATFSVDPGSVGITAAQFNASGSYSTNGVGIATYIWNFGDGSPVEETTSPFISHAYTAIGNYRVSLTVVDGWDVSTNKIYTGRSMLVNGGGNAVFTKIIPEGTPLPPKSLKVTQVANRYLTQTDIVNVLVWSTPKGSNAVTYQVFRDAELTEKIGTISAKAKLRFEDHNRKKDVSYSYYVIGLDAQGHASITASVTFTPPTKKG